MTPRSTATPATLDLPSLRGLANTACWLILLACALSVAQTIGC